MSATIDYIVLPGFRSATIVMSAINRGRGWAIHIYYQNSS